MKSLVVINACVRQADSRTLRIAEPVIEALAKRYKITRYLYKTVRSTRARD